MVFRDSGETPAMSKRRPDDVRDITCTWTFCAQPDLTDAHHHHKSHPAMPSSAALRCNALSGIKRLASAEPLLPFLYNTQTIRLQHHDALSDFANALEYKSQAPQPNPNQGDGQRKQPRIRGRKEGGAQQYERRLRKLESTTEKRVYRDRNVGERDYAPPEKPEGQYQRPQREEHIPFEHAEQETTSIRERIAGSTMTPSEKKAFEELLSLPQQKGSSNVKRRKNNLEDVLDQAVAQRKRRDLVDSKPPMPEALKKMQENLKHDRNARQRVLLDEAVGKDIKRVNEAFAAARTDVELWEVLHTKVLSRVKSLGLDQPVQQSPKQSLKQQKRNANPEDTALRAETPRWPGDIPDQLVIAEALPQHVVDCQHMLIYDFPATHLGVSLLPYLKSLGPTTFALAASTKLYNNHIRALRGGGNFPSIMHTLEEMDKEVYEFNDKTHDLVNWIYKRSFPARQGTYGAGVAALWNGERYRKAVASATRWHNSIAERMQEQALREARAKEEEVSKIAGVY
jgi:hypothetical protein